MISIYSIIKKVIPRAGADMRAVAKNKLKANL